MAITIARHATMDSDRREINVSAESLDVKTGEVQASPTTNTILGRLKNIETNTANSGSGLISMASVTITRPTNTTSYAINDIMNQAGASTLPYVDFGVGNANKKFELNGISITSNSTKSSGALPIIYFFNNATIGSQNLADNQAWNPAFADVIAYKVLITEAPTIFLKNGADGYSVLKSEMRRFGQLSSDGKLYMALIQSTAYSPDNGESHNISIKCTIY